MKIALFCLALAVLGPGQLEARPKDRLKDLNLTEEQAAQIEKLREAHHAEMKDLRSGMRSKREALDSAMKGDASEAKLRSMFTELQSHRQKLAEKRFEQMLAIRKVLTPDQRKKFRNIAEGRKGKRNKHKSFSDMDDDAE